MSKKKTSAGNTMTLKDFHGGSIPSDLPLPSAPGVIVRSTNENRLGFDRQPTAWGNPVNRSSDHRLRPNSSGSMRNNGLDDKTLFMSSSANIGRNFDEDERKPLDGGPSAPRRTVSDDVIRGPVISSGPRGDVGRVNVGRESSGLGLSSGGSLYSARVVEGPHSGVVSMGVRPNPWGVRKEVVVKETVSPPSSGQNTVSKFAQASALDKISSGRWQTKLVQNQADIEVIRPSDSPSSLYASESAYFGGGGLQSEREYLDTTLVRHVERGLAIEDGIRSNFREGPNVERVRSPGAFDGKERGSVLFTNNGQPAYVPPEEKMSEKPKLNLLPRTKPLGVPEPSIGVYKQGPQQLINPSHSETASNNLGNGRNGKPGTVSSEVSHVKSGLSSNDATNQAAERPKLNLKPRSQPLDKSEVNPESKRIPLFGGARPRETVLKERGVDDVLSSHDDAQSPSRGSDIPRTEVPPVRTSTIRHTERVPNHSVDHKAGRVHERKEQPDIQKTGRFHEKKEQPDIQKTDMQRKNWRNENWRSVKDTEKPPQQERPPSPETWRKPVEPSKPTETDNTLRFGKAVSAVELAQAFSRPATIPKPVDHFSGQRGLPGRTQIPFSRLTGASPRPQVNGF